MSTLDRLFRRYEMSEEMEVGKAIDRGRGGAIARFIVVLMAFLLLLPWREAHAQPVVIATIPSGGGVIAANPTTNRIYVAQDPAASVARIDGATNTVISPAIPTSGFHTGIAANPVTNRIYVSQQFAGQVRVVNGSTDAVLSDCSPPGLGVVNGVAVNHITNRLYVVRNDAQVVGVVDAATCAPVAIIPTIIPINGRGPEHDGIGVNPVTNRIYVSNRFNNTVTVIDGATNTIITTVGVGNGPGDVEVNSSTNRIYISNSADNTVSVIDGATNSVLPPPIPVGTFPVGIGVNPLTNRVYVANNGSNNVSVIDGNTNTVVATVGVGAQPAFLAVNPATSRIYVTNTTPGTVSVIEDTVLDHFRCYEAEGNPVNVTVNLEDQFGEEPNVMVGQPKLFCNPVDKNSEGIRNPTVHLTCYEIEDVGEELDVSIKNQFGEQSLKVEKPELLCVPSEKISVVPMDDDDDD